MAELNTSQLQQKRALELEVHDMPINRDMSHSHFLSTGDPDPTSPAEAVQSEFSDTNNDRKQFCIIEQQNIDRYNYKRAYSNKAKLKYDAEVAASVLASLAREASGMATNS